MEFKGNPKNNVTRAKKGKVISPKGKKCVFGIAIVSDKRNREYEDIMELIMAQAKTTTAKKAATKIKPKKEAVEISARNKKIGIYIGLGLIVLLILGNLIG